MKINTMSRMAAIVFAFPSTLVIQGASAADDGRQQDKPFLVWTRAFFASVDSNIRADSQTLGLSGTLLDLEADLGIDDNNTLPIIGAQWRFAKRHAVELAYFELNRSGNLVIDTQIRWEDFVYPINVNVSSFFDTSVTRIAYRYSLVSDATKELAIGVGIHWTEMEAGIGEATIGSTKVESEAPMAMFTLSFASRLSPKWSLQILGEWFDLDFVGLDGEIWHADAAVVWHAWDQVGFSLGYNYFKVDFRIGDADFRGLFDYTYQGPFVGVEFAF